MIRDKMGIVREDEKSIPDYRSIYLIELGKQYNAKGQTINKYGASDDKDREILSLLSDGSKGSAAPGSICYFLSGMRYVLGNDGWNLFGCRKEGELSDFDYDHGTFAIAVPRSGSAEGGVVDG